MTEKSCQTCQHLRRDPDDLAVCAHPLLLKFKAITDGVSVYQMDLSGLCLPQHRQMWEERTEEVKPLKRKFEPKKLPRPLIKRVMAKVPQPEIVKRGRGRPTSTAPKQANPNWKWFNCIYANSVAQVYQRSPIPNTKTGLVVEKPNDPTNGFYPGQCFVTFMRIRDNEQVLDIWPFPEIEAMDAHDAIRLARDLFEESGEDNRYGDDPDTHERGQYRLFANEVYDVRYWSDGDTKCSRPFIIFHRPTAKILVTGLGHIHRFTTLKDAIDKAEELVKPYRRLHV